MANLHNAIRAIHNSVATIDGSSQDDIVAIDKDGNEVSINWTSVNSWTDPDQYKFDRQKEYPSIVNQLDDLYHNGIDGWKANIQIIKDKYPKE